jgi:hypothetical protein
MTGMKTMRLFLMAGLVLTGVFTIHAQTAAELDEILTTAELSNAQAARFTLAAADIVLENPSHLTAFEKAMDRQWFARDAKPETPITYAELSQLLLKAFSLNGGVMYALLPGPRYAYRTLSYYKLLTDEADPGLRVTGVNFLQILGQVLSYVGEFEAHEAAEQERLLMKRDAE